MQNSKASQQLRFIDIQKVKPTSNKPSNKIPWISKYDFFTDTCSLTWLEKDDLVGKHGFCCQNRDCEKYDSALPYLPESTNCKTCKLKSLLPLPRGTRVYSCVNLPCRSSDKSAPEFTKCIRQANRPWEIEYKMTKNINVYSPKTTTKWHSCDNCRDEWVSNNRKEQAKLYKKFTDCGQFLPDDILKLVIDQVIPISKDIISLFYVNKFFNSVVQDNEPKFGGYVKESKNSSGGYHKELENSSEPKITIHCDKIPTCKTCGRDGLLSNGNCLNGCKWCHCSNRSCDLFGFKNVEYNRSFPNNKKCIACNEKSLVVNCIDYPFNTCKTRDTDGFASCITRDTTSFYPIIKSHACKDCKKEYSARSYFICYSDSSDDTDDYSGSCDDWY
jgi:hypothetical protein